MNFESSASFSIERDNIFTIQQVRDGEVIWEESVANLVTNVGKNAILNVFFNAVAASTNWYIGLINGTGFSALSAADTMASHAGWTEFVTYSEGTRQEFDATTSTAQSVTSTAIATFNIGTVSAQTIQGLFLCDVSTKGGTTGQLFSATAFSSPANILTGDAFKVTYTINA